MASDVTATALEELPKTMNAIIRFPSEEAVWKCYNDLEYQEIKKVRLATTENCTMLITKQFRPHSTQ